MAPAVQTSIRRFAARRPAAAEVLRSPMAVVMGLAVLVRLGLMLGYPTALLGFNDSLRFIRTPGFPRSTGLFGDTWMPAGYPAFLDVAHALTAWLPFTIGLQHLLGLGTGLLIYLAARRAGTPRWLAVVPGAIVLFHPDQLYLEHTLLAETLFTFFIAAGLYAAVRAAHGPARWAIAAGLLMALAALTRSVGLPLVLIVVAWLALAAGGDWRRRVGAAALAGVPAIALIGVYIATVAAAGGFTGLSDMAGWNLYGRVAQFADCSKFTPPAGTEQLCETTPPDRRGGPFFYIWNLSSHGRQVSGQRLEPENGGDPGRFARAAVLGQPLDYAGAVAKDLARFADPSFGADRPESGGLQLPFSFPRTDSYARGILGHLKQHYYGYSERRTLMPFFESYERILAPGPLGVLLMLAAAAAGLAFGRGRARHMAALFAATAVALYVGSVATWSFDIRYGLPPLGALAVAAVLGGVALADRASARRAAEPAASRAPAGAARPSAV